MSTGRSPIDEVDELYSRAEQRVLVRRRSEAPEHFISQLYEDLIQAIELLEKGANHYPRDKFDETSLTKQIVDRMACFGYAITAESDSRGHVDVTVTSHRKTVTWLGEAKIHKDYGWLHKGLEQLVGRYTTGRHADAALLIYIYNKNAATVLDSWSTKIKEEKLCELVGEPSKRERTTFNSTHAHPSWGVPLLVRHLGISLYYNPKV